MIWFVESLEGLVLAAFTTKPKAMHFRAAQKRPTEWVVRPCDLDPEPSED